MKKTFFQELGGFDVSMKYAEDYDRLSNDTFVKSGYNAYYMMDHFSMYY